MPKCWKQKDQKKIGFWAKNGEPIEALTNWLRYWSTCYSFPIEVQLRVTVTCQALNAPMVNEPVDPQLDRSMLFLVFWLTMLETYKLRAPLHLWVREHLHLFVYLLVIAIKTLIHFHLHILWCTLVIHPSLELYLNHCWVRLRDSYLLIEC